MRKVFLSTIPLQSVKQYKYASASYPNCSSTAFPIVAAIEQQLQEGDKAVVISIVTHSEGTHNKAVSNYSDFKAQVNCIVKEKGVSLQHIEISVEDKSYSASHLELFNKIFNELQDEDEIYADITYGFKSNPVVIFAALNQAYQFKEDIDIKEIIYGNLFNGTSTPVPEIVEITSLFYMNSLAGSMGTLNNDTRKKLYIKF